MTKGKYGEFGGQYIPETLMHEIKNLEKSYDFYKNDEKQFIRIYFHHCHSKPHEWNTLFLGF